METKTFEELTLNDGIYFKNEGSTCILRINGIKEHDSSRRKIVITDGDNEDHELPRDETLYKVDDSVMYTTDKLIYKEWRKPLVEKFINDKREHIKDIESEIAELEKELL